MNRYVVYNGVIYIHFFPLEKLPFWGRCSWQTGRYSNYRTLLMWICVLQTYDYSEEWDIAKKSIFLLLCKYVTDCTKETIKLWKKRVGGILFISGSVLNIFHSSCPSPLVGMMAALCCRCKWGLNPGPIDLSKHSTTATKPLHRVT